MKLNRIPALAALAVALMIVVGQFISGAKAAPAAAPAAHFQASGVIAQASPPTKANAAQPADQSPLDFTVQGRLTDPSGNPITVATAVVFNLYSVPSGGTAEMTQSTAVTPDANGLFTYVFVVDTTSNFNNVRDFASKQYLGIKAGSDAEMAPRFELTAAPYAMSLAPGARIFGDIDYGTNSDHGVLNLDNLNTSDSRSAGLYATGPRGVWGGAASNSGGASMGGYFDNTNNDAGNNQFGVKANASNGWGVYGESDGGSGLQDSAGVVGVSTAPNGISGVFTGTHLGLVAVAGSNPPAASGFADGVTGLSSVASGDGVFGHATGANGYGVFGYATGANGYGVLGSAYFGPASAVGGFFLSYDNSATHTGIDVEGKGLASGGFVTGLGYYMTVKYDGSDTLQPGDILAPDSNNTIINGTQVLGTVKATAENAGAAIGVAQYRIQVYEGQSNTGPRRVEQTDTTGAIKPGDLVEIVIAGQAQVKVSGSVNSGDRLAIASDGSITATKDSTNSIGKVASKPDSNGMVTIVVNFK